MFKQRLVSSLILIPMVLILIFFTNTWILGGIILLITLLAGKEYLQLIPIGNIFLKVGYLLLLALCVLGSSFLFPYWHSLGLWLWLLIIMAIISYPSSEDYWGYPPIIAIFFLLLWPLFIQSMVSIYFLPQGKALLIYLLFLVWSADIGAYLVGKRWGHTKLIPKVSPGKSWQGIYGGCICVSFTAIFGFFYFTPFSIFRWFFWSILTFIMSIIGDLFMSLLKRRCHLKDTGTIIYGHGGLLDRLDSLIAATPVFYLGLIYIPLGI